MLEFWKGFSAFFLASSFLYENKMLRWYLLPIVLWVTLFLGLAISVSDWAEIMILHWLKDSFGLSVDIANSTGEGWLLWMKAALSIFMAFIIKIMVWLFLGRVMKYVILIIMAPVMANLSEKTETLINGREYSFNLQQMLLDACRGALVSLRNLLLETGLWLIAFLSSLVFPLLAIPAMLIMLVVTAYFMGFNMFYYLLERQKTSISETVLITRQYRGHVLGLGMAYNLVSMIPVLDWVIAPINGPVGAVLAARKTTMLPQ
jgi:CysZ protein